MSLNGLKGETNFKEIWADEDGYGFRDYLMKKLDARLTPINVIMSCLDEYSRSTTNPFANYLRSQEFKRLSFDKQKEVIIKILGLNPNLSNENLSPLILEALGASKEDINIILSRTNNPKQRVVNKEIIKLTDSDIISLWTGKWHLEFERLFLDEKKPFLDAFVLSAQSIKGENEEFNKVFMSYIDKNTFKKEKFLAKICSVTYGHTSRTKFLESIYKNIPRASSRYQEIIDKFYFDKQKQMKDLGLVKKLRNNISVK